MRAIEQVSRQSRGKPERSKSSSDFGVRCGLRQFAQIAKMTGEKLPFTRFQRSLTIEGPRPLPAVGQAGLMEQLAELATHVELSRLARALDVWQRAAA